MLAFFDFVMLILMTTLDKRVSLAVLAGLFLFLLWQVNPARVFAGTYNCGTCSNGGTKWCTNGSGSCLIGCYCEPSTGNLTLAVGQTEQCVDSACNSKDIIVDLDKDHNQKLPVRAVFGDADPGSGGSISNIRYARIYFDTNNNPADGYYYGIEYTDTQDGNYTFTYSGSKNTEIRVENATASFVNPWLTVNLDLVLDGLNGTGAFLSNAYLQAVDFGDLDTGVVRKIGTGAFLVTDDPESGNAAAAMDVWNGKDVQVIGKFYEVADPSDICVADKSGLTPVSNFNLDPSYDPASPNWSDPITNWASGTLLQPYYFYNSQSYTVDYLSASGQYYLMSMDNQRYGGTCYDDSSEVIGAQVRDVQYREGGVRVADSSRAEAAFGVGQMAGSWSTTLDGNYFTASSINVAIVDSTCSSCYLTDILNMDTNGLAVVNGTIGSEINNRYGNPNNWYAVEGGTPSKKPFSYTELPSYNNIKAMYEGTGYTELTGNKLLSEINVQEDTVYFINGNLTIDANLNVAQDTFVLFVVSGNLTVRPDVTDVDGLFFVQGDATIEDNGVANLDPNDRDEQFTLRGSLAVVGTTYINRTMGVANNYAPPVIFQSRQDMLVALANSLTNIVAEQRIWLGEF